MWRRGGPHAPESLQAAAGPGEAPDASHQRKQAAAG
jgi:hypothetical protein